MRKIEYSFDEIMERFGIVWDGGIDSGLVLKENEKYYKPNLIDIARMGAVVMRLEEKVKRLNMIIKRVRLK